MSAKLASIREIAARDIGAQRKVELIQGVLDEPDGVGEVAPEPAALAEGADAPAEG